MKKMLIAIAIGAAALGSVLGSNLATASDHDDGQTNIKTKNTNLTDLYVFRKGEEAAGQTADDNGDTLVFIMNSNDRSLPRQRYYFNTNARYEFNISRFTGNPANDAPSSTLSKDATLRFEFGAPNAQNQQAMTVSYIDSRGILSTTKTTGGADILTTDIQAKGSGVAGIVSNDITLHNQPLKVFAGLRQDPFYFDVNAYFALRADVANNDGAITNLFNTDANASDFTRNYNVLSIVVEIPRALLQGGAGAANATTFDIWETVSIPQS